MSSSSKRHRPFAKTALIPTVSMLRGFHPLTELDAQCLNELLSVCHVEHCAAQTILDLQKWQGELVYLLKGEVKLEFVDGSTLVLVGGTDVASQPLGKIGGLPHSAKLITEIDLLRFDADRLDILLTWNQLAAGKKEGVAQVALEGKQSLTFAQQDILGEPDWACMKGLFAASNLADGVFAGLPPAHIDQLLQRFQRFSVKRGDVLIQQGEPGDYYYVIETGRCHITRTISGSTMLVAKLEAGDAFGEEALVNGQMRNATATMKTDGVLLRLDKQDFIELLREPLMLTYTHAEARRRVLSGAIWLDVRFSAEYLYDGLPGARNLPLNHIRETCLTLDQTPEYIVYCQSGRRSSAATFLLAQRGFQVALLEGGLCGSGRAYGLENIKSDGESVVQVNI